MVGITQTTAQLCVKTRLKCCQVTSCSIFYGFCGVFMFFSSACVMSFHVCFFEILSEICMAPQFRACRTGLQRNASFKCCWWLRYSEMAFFTHVIYFFCFGFFAWQVYHVARGYSETEVFGLFRGFVTARCTFFDVYYG